MGVKAQVGGVPVIASNVAYANITCIVVSPIVITKVQDMHFGTIMQGVKGTIVLSPDGSPPTSTGNITVGNNKNSATVATFEVTDNLGNNPNTVRMFTEYTITLPSNEVILTTNSGTSTMRVSNFTSSPASNENGTLVNGLGHLSVGATLYVEADQGLGQYTSSAPFPVTVNFN
jgi:hypothetical protein